MKEKVIYRKRDVEIIDFFYENDKVRAFFMDDALHSAMFVDEDKRESLLFPYMRNFDGVFTLNREIRRTLVIGGGMYVYPRHLSGMGLDVDVAEINPEYIELARKYFFLTPDDESRMHVFHEDGRGYVRRNKNAYDAIFMDAFVGMVPSRSLTSVEAIQDVHASLREGGVYVVNYLGFKDFSRSQSLKNEILTLKEDFAHVLAVRADIKDEAYRTNYVLFASDTHDAIEGMCEYDLSCAEVIHDLEYWG